MYKLLTRGNTKTLKGEKYGYMTFILHLAPHTLAGYGNMCPASTPGKPPGEKDAPDVLACLATQQISPILMGQGFNIIDAVVSLYFEPLQPGKASRVLHIDLKQSGISNLRDMEEADARLVESLLRALGVMQSPATAKLAEEAEGVMHE